MKNDNITSAEQGGNANGMPVQLKLLLGVLMLAILAVVLKISGAV